MTRDRQASQPRKDSKLAPETPQRQVDSTVERHRLEQVMRESDELHRLILSNISETVFITDSAGIFTFISPNVERIFGYSFQEVQEFHSITQLLGVNVFQWEDLEISGEISNIEREITDKVGQQHTLSINVKQVCIHGGTLLYSCRDITEYKQAQEEALRQSETCYRAVVEDQTELICRFLPDGILTFVNEAYCCYLGKQRQELVGKSFLELIPEAKQHLAALSQTNSIGIHEYQAIALNGKIRWQQWTTQAIFNPQGKLVAFQAVGRDITERKEAQESLRRQLAAVEAAMDGIATLNSKGEYLYLNEAHVKLFGYSSSTELVGKTWHILYYPDEINRIEQDIFPQLLQLGRWRGETIAKRKDGSTFFEEVSLTLTEDGGLICVCRDITDRKRAELEIKEAKERFELVIRASQDGFWDWNLLTGEIYFSPRWKEMMGYSDHELSNDWATWQKVIFEEDRIAALKLIEDYNSGSVSRFLTTQRFHHKNSSTVHILSRAIHLKDSQGQVVRMIGANSDITELVHVQEALQALTKQEREKATQLELALQELQHTQTQLLQKEKMASLGQLVAGVAHEINNPTSFIYGNINPAMEYAQDLLHLLRLYQRHYPQPVAEITEQRSIIDPDFLAEDFPKLLASMKEGAERIAKIVLSLRNFSRLDETELKRVDIHEGIDNTLLILQHRLKQQSSRSEIQVIREYGQLPSVECYPSQLNQVFMNLLCNAIDALEEARESESEFSGVIRICTEVIARSSPKSLNGDRTSLQQPTLTSSGKFNCYSIDSSLQQNPLEEMGNTSCVVIRISDNGPGITADVQSRLFDPFFTTKPPGKGTGLGLSISYQIVVDKHKGQLLCHSGLGLGTEFMIELPLAQSKSACPCKA